MKNSYFVIINIHKYPLKYCSFFFLLSEKSPSTLIRRVGRGNLPDLAKRLIESGENVGAYPVSERSWMDMGQFTEMEDMKRRLGI